MSLRLQLDTYSCGAIAVYNAFTAMGIKSSLKGIKKDSATTREHGAQPGGLLQAIERAGATGTEVQGSFDSVYKQLHVHLEGGNAAILLTEEGQHWEAAIGVLGDRVVVFDGQRSINSGYTVGTFVLTPAQLRRYWSAWGTTGRYGILIAL